jgi:hypothetical protein
MSKASRLARLRERRRRRDERLAERAATGRQARAQAEREHAVGHQPPQDTTPPIGGVG